MDKDYTPLKDILFALYPRAVQHLPRSVTFMKSRVLKIRPWNSLDRNNKKYKQKKTSILVPELSIDWFLVGLYKNGSLMCHVWSNSCCNIKCYHKLIEKKDNSK